jgi:hypothetical protein
LPEWSLSHAVAVKTLLDVRYALSLAQLEIRSLRLARALKRFNASQPRVPAGHPDGGQWTGGGGGGGTPRADLVTLRPRAPARRVIGGRAYPVTPAQEARLDITAAQARALVREASGTIRAGARSPAFTKGPRVRSAQTSSTPSKHRRGCVNWDGTSPRGARSPTY